MGVAVVLQFCGFVFWAATSGAGFSDDCDGENYLQNDESDAATILDTRDFVENALDLCAMDGAVLALTSLLVTVVFVVLAAIYLLLNTQTETGVYLDVPETGFSSPWQYRVLMLLALALYALGFVFGVAGLGATWVSWESDGTLWKIEEYGTLNDVDYS